MKNNTSHLMLFPLLTLILVAAFLSQVSVQAQDNTAGETSALAKAFRDPPDAAKPQTWWHWMNGNVTREGITADLEAMARIGLGGATIFDVDQDVPAGPITILSPEWQAMIQHALTEAKRLGLEITLQNCPGFTVSGGPWVTPAGSMQDVVWSETAVQGPATFSAALPAPPRVRNYYRDIAVYAVPAPPGGNLDLAALKPSISTSVPGVDGAAVMDGDITTFITLPRVEGRESHYVQFAFREPVTFGSVLIRARDSNMSTSGWIEVGDDGVQFRKIATFSFIHRGAGHFALAGCPQTQARFVRISFTGTDYYVGKQWDFTEIAFGAARIEQLAAKAAFVSDPSQTFSDRAWPASLCIAPGQVVDLSAQMSADGKLTWEVPSGRWTILRFGHTSTGKQVGAAPLSGRGLECDKMSATAVEAHFNALAGKIIEQAGPLAGRTLTMILADSWEARCQNWTPAFRQEFQERRGYDPLPWLPVLTGRAIDTVDNSERFLWDFRRTIGDLIAENHYGVLQRLCARHGLAFTAEAPGIMIPTIADELQCKKYTDVPMGEFWMQDHNDSREAASAAHIYGKRIASAEAFTAHDYDAAWAKAPFDHKALGDLNFCRGINRFVFHRYAMQPWTQPAREPGMTMGPWGINLERTQTWWEPARAWMRYLQRCQYLLQQGLFVADVAYFYGEGAPSTLWHREPGVPAGYDYDAVNADVLLNRMSVRDGRLVLPDGMSYRLLLLPDSRRMTPEVLEKIAALVQAGAVVVGPRPEKSPSLAGGADADARLTRLAARVWGDCDGKKITAHDYGKGRVIWGRPLAAVLKELAGAADFSANGDDRFRAIHRRLGGTDIYFVSNQSQEQINARLSFRAGARVPEIWHPESGTRETAAAYTTADGLVTLPLRFDPAGSVFVVFEKSSDRSDPIHSFTLDGRDLFAPEALPGAGTLHIQQALYGMDPAKNERCVDLTGPLNAAIANGRLTLSGFNSLAGDPAPDAGKKLVIDYVFNQRRTHLELPEHARLQLPTAQDLAGGVLVPPAAEIIVSPQGSWVVQAAVPGRYEIRTASGRTIRADIASVPEPLPLMGPWSLHFPPNRGAPEVIELDKTISWTDHADAGVRYFSGTASYEKDLMIPPERLGAGRELWLDLGMVKHLANVSLNGQDLGVLWKPPFRVNITAAAKPGRNQLVIKVTNLWPNRLMGDEQLPPDCELVGKRLKAWPQWLLDGKPSPTGRFTFTTWHYWTKDMPLLESGLIGPVTLRTVALRPLPR